MLCIFSELLLLSLQVVFLCLCLFRIKIHLNALKRNFYKHLRFVAFLLQSFVTVGVNVGKCNEHGSAFNTLNDSMLEHQRSKHMKETRKVRTSSSVHMAS